MSIIHAQFAQLPVPGGFRVILADPPWLFARSRRPGWVSWGNETDKFAGAA